MLQADAFGQEQLANLLGVRVPPEWPDSNWEPHVLAYIQQQLQDHPGTAGWNRYILLPEAESLLIGTCCATPVRDNAAEVGYAILKRWQGHGYASEALSGLITTLFASGACTLVAHTYPHLTASLRVMEKCGFTYEGPGEEGTVRYRLQRPRSY